MSKTRHAAKAFPVGAKVTLKNITGCDTGVVEGHSKGRVIVRWLNWNSIGRHFCARPNPRSRLG